jgi:cytochrome P450
MTNNAALVPDYVKPEQIVEFDIYNDTAMKADLHGGMKQLHAKAPDIFYSPCNGGHWVVTRFDLMSQILRDTEHFSNKELVIPKSNSPFVMIPLNLDPPDHAFFRTILMREFSPKAVNAMEPKLRERAARLIDDVIAQNRDKQGGCDFTEALGAGFPVKVFMDLMGMSLDRFDEFRNIVHEYFGQVSNERRHELESTIFRINGELIAARRSKPQDDLMSRLLAAEMGGRMLTDDEILSICFVLFLGGLDTVANALTFAFRHLATDPALRKKLAANSALLPAFVEESLRRYAVVNQTRVVKRDIEIDGAHFTEGDMVMCALALAGMDETKNSEPMQFDVERENRQHITFSIGAHMCVGNVLARNEMRIFTEEFLKRIPDFRLANDAPLGWRPGLVMALPSLPLAW